MSNVVYYNIPAYLESCSSLIEEIEAVNSIIRSMRAALLRAATTGHFEEYKLDTGQTKNEVRYRSLNELELVYEKLLKLRGMLYAELNANRQGRVIRLVDGKNFL